MTGVSIDGELTSITEARKKVGIWRREKKRIVFTNGCFDLLHPGHVHYLEAAKALGDVLIVGINDDDSVRRLKGPARPVNDLDHRACMLAALKSVDMVVPFSEDTPLNLIVALMPDVLVKGGDYVPDDIVGAREIRENGGEVVIIPFLEGHSSTKMIARIRALEM
ncbi:MAG: D-glycero-beta-D-manno-heptose 1-phosphate adenylyltransferase [Mariprofundaceae bacterium]|nr:D-glycero-beta-D-manno-heptose 1-phosphate adenylyltransferase [Mariprofundaceae bacterium]